MNTLWQTDAGRRPALAYRPLGAFRFVLALLVMLQHFTNIAPAGFTALVAPLHLGSMAVLVFFAVSGFVIAEAIEAHYRDRPGAFLTNRAIRIYPPLLAALAAAFVVYGLLLLTYGSITHPKADIAAPLGWEILAPRSLVANLASLLPLPRGDGGDAFRFISVAWSIRVEFMFYFVMAAALLLPARFYRPGLVAGTVVGMSVFAVHFRGIGPQFLQFIPYFVYGVALFYALSGHRAAWCLVVIGLAGCAVQASVIGLPASDGANNGALATMQVATVRDATLGALLLMIPLLAGLSAGRFEALDRALGDLSYPLYLNHCLALPIVRSLWGSVSTEGLMIVSAAMIAFSVAMYLVIEPALDGLRSRIRRADKTPGTDRRAPKAAPALPAC